MYAKRAAAALEELRPEPGDVVEVGAPEVGELGEVSSIADDGQLYFRGGGGYRARPHVVRMFARKSDLIHTDAVTKAREQAAARVTNPGKVGRERVAELAKWQVSDLPGNASLFALQDALDSAKDERPLQKVLEKHPEILAYLVTGNKGVYVIPQPKLGKEYVPDFLIAGETSAGLSWTLVELESPTAQLTIADGQPAQQLRKAIQQITDWREWLAVNLDYARRSIAENGLGLPGIRHDPPGLIIISRESYSSVPDIMRLREPGARNIEIRTYDWLLRSLGRHRVGAVGILRTETAQDSQGYSW